MTRHRAALCRLLLGLGAAACAFAAAAANGDTFIVMASTTSTEQSGLFAPPAAGVQEGHAASTCGWSRVGTGQALDMGRRGDADVLFVHDQAGRGEVRRRRLRPAAPPRDVQRLRPGRAGSRPGRHPRQGHRRGAEEARRVAARASSRAATERHARRRAALLEAGRHRRPRCPGAGKAFGYRACGCGMGPALNIAVEQRRLRARRSRHLAVVQEPRRPGDPGRRRHAPVQPVRRDRRQPGQASARQDGAGAGLRRLGGLADGQATIAAYKIGGEQLFFPNAER